MSTYALAYWPEDMDPAIGFAMMNRVINWESTYRELWDELTPRDIFGGFVNPPSIQFIYDTIYSPLPSPITVPYGVIFPSDAYFNELDLGDMPVRPLGGSLGDPFEEARIISVALCISQYRSLQLAMQAEKLTVFGKRGR